MNDRDLCLIGLLAIACLVVDVLREDVLDDRPPARRLPPEAMRLGCPRNAVHLARARADGAVWCFHCDGAFYPRAAEWEGALRAVAA